jgi:hypothetical protein
MALLLFCRVVVSGGNSSAKNFFETFAAKRKGIRRMFDNDETLGHVVSTEVPFIPFYFLMEQGVHSRHCYQAESSNHLYFSWENLLVCCGKCAPMLESLTCPNGSVQFDDRGRIMFS